MQSLFLEDAMQMLRLGRPAFCQRIGVSDKGLGKWMSPRNGAEFRRMPLIAWKYICEIMDAARPSDTDR
jgi:hypothetical protein